MRKALSSAFRVYRHYNNKIRIIAGQYKSNPGYCLICESDTKFYEEDPWLRDHYLCEKCRSIPRNRAIVEAMNVFIPTWKEKVIHESSPYGPSSDYFRSRCKNYTFSHFFPGIPSGDFYNGTLCENLEALSFERETIDVFVTQDVFEHVMNPDKAFAEISRVLKMGGVHLYTLPWYPQLQTTIQRAKLVGSEIQFLAEPIYHGNPIDEKGSLVTFDWGLDIGDFIYQHSKMTTQIYLHKDRSLGLDGEFLHVFCSYKTS